MSPRRLLPDEPLPPYSYVPGRFPHPVSDPAGHSYGAQPASVEFDPKRWRDCRAYLRGIDLFNHGYYWEAHEVWEQLWHAVGRHGVYADFFKGLIQLAAAGVKRREGVEEGVRNHARRALELFRTVEPVEDGKFMGLKQADLEAIAAEFTSRPGSIHDDGHDRFCLTIML